MVKAFRVVAEVDEPMAIVNFNIKKTQHLESKYSGDFSANIVARVGKVKGDQILVVMPNGSESHNGPFRTVNLVHIP